MFSADKYSEHDLGILTGELRLSPFLFTFMGRGEHLGFIFNEDLHFFTLAAVSKRDEEEEFSFSYHTPIIRINKSQVLEMSPICGELEKGYLTFLLEEFPKLGFRGRLGEDFTEELQSRLQELEDIEYINEVSSILHGFMQEQTQGDISSSEEENQEEPKQMELDLDMEGLLATNTNVSSFSMFKNKRSSKQEEPND